MSKPFSKCNLCGTLSNAGITCGITFHRHGVCAIDMKEVTLCLQCSKRIYPMFQDIVMELNGPGYSEMRREYQKLKNRVYVLEKKLKGEET